MRDVNGNSIAKVDFTQSASQLIFYSELILQQYDTNPLDFILEESAVNYPFVYDPDSLPELAAFMAHHLSEGHRRAAGMAGPVLEAGRQDRNHRPAAECEPAHQSNLSIPAAR